MNSKIAYWLIPIEKHKRFFQGMIERLAREYDAPLFEPHVTIYSGDHSSENRAHQLIDRATERVGEMTLQFARLSSSEKFTKTVFVEFHASPSLSSISQALRSGSGQPSHYVLQPHLSVIYKKMSKQQRDGLIRTLSIPYSEIRFDEIRAVLIPPEIRSKKDVEDWKVISIKKLPPIPR